MVDFFDDIVDLGLDFFFEVPELELGLELEIFLKSDLLQVKSYS